MTNGDLPSPITVSKIARSPAFTSVFVDSFDAEYVQKCLNYASFQQTAERPYESSLFAKKIFVHLRGAIYVYRQLNLKRLLKSSPLFSGHTALRVETSDAILPELPFIVLERFEKFMSQQQAMSFFPVRKYQPDRYFVSAFVNSTEHVIREIIQNYSRLQQLIVSPISFDDNAWPPSIKREEIAPLSQEILEIMDRIVEMYQINESQNGELFELMRQYRLALELLYEPQGLYESHGIERLHIAALEINSFHRIKSAFPPDPTQSAQINSQVLAALRDWRELHDILMTQIIQLDQTSEILDPSRIRKPKGLVAAFALPTISVADPSKVTVSPLQDATESTNRRTAELPSLRSVTRSVESFITKLARSLRAHATISPEKHSLTIKEIDKEGILMPSHYPPTLIRFFAAGIWGTAAGFIALGTGLLLDHFMTKYIGTGLISIGLSTITLALMHANQLDEQRSQ
jgi:hypothetical protein